MQQLAMFDFETPVMKTLDTSRCYARPVNHLTAATMVKEYHYAHRVPSIVASFGMYVDHVLAGVITFGTVTTQIGECCGPDYRYNVVELNRLFIHDWAGRNSESWFLGQVFKLMQEQAPNRFILVSYADTGEGHIGLVYQATNWLYTGESRAYNNAFLLFPDGRTSHSADWSQRLGTAKSAELLEMFPGSKIVGSARKHRYVYFLGDKRQRRKLRKLLKWDVLPYPKANN